MINPLIYKQQQSNTYLALALVAGLCVMVLLGHLVTAFSFGERLFALRMWHMIFAGFSAFIVPHIVFPQAQIGLVHLLNPSPKYLSFALIHKFRSIPIAGIVLSGLILFWGSDNTPWWSFFQSVLYIPAIWFLALAWYTSIGEASQAWKEGHRGQSYRRYFKEVGGVPIAPGAVPTQLRTIGIALMGMLATLFSADWVHSPVLSTLPYLMLVLGATGLWIHLLSRADRHFYCTHAFFSEFFTADGSGLPDRAPLHFDNVYWIPLRWRPAAWGTLVQMDRQLPMGRLLLVGHLILFLSFYFNITSDLREAFLFLFLLAHQGGLLLGIQHKLAPAMWTSSIQSPTDWVLSRWMMQWRWMMPLALHLLGAAWLNDSFLFHQAYFWLIAYLLLSLISAFIVTLIHEVKTRKRYA